MPRITQTSFNSGELSPWLVGRTDQEKYSSGCRVLRNMALTVYGGARRRPGTEYLGEAGDMTEKVRLVDFIFSQTTTFILEFGHLYIRFWVNGALVESGGSPYEVTTTYDGDDLAGLQFAQINDIVFIVHPDYSPQRLSRIADDNWTIADLPNTALPLLDEEDTAVTLTPSAVTGSGVTVTASAATFTADMVGEVWAITERIEAQSNKSDLNANFTTAAFRVDTDYTIRTTGTWTGFLELQAKIDGAWETTKAWRATSDFNVVFDGLKTEPTEIRLKYAHTSGATGEAYIEIPGVDAVGRFEITAFTSSTVVSADVVTDFNSTTASDRWQVAAWGEGNGYPRSVTLHEQRLCFGGNANRPQTVWLSAIDDFYNFKIGVEADDSMSLTLASDSQNPIESLLSRDNLSIFTSASEWTLEPASEGALTPTNAQVKRRTTYGSERVQALVVNDSVLFVQRRGRKVREFAYSFERDNFVGSDLTLLAEHITDGGITQIAFQQQRDSILWAVTGDGNLIGMTYERDQNVVGWHCHTTDGLFESVATIPGTGEDDEIWVVVKRTIDGTAVRYVERFKPNQYRVQEDEDKDALWFVDCGASYSGAATTSITGLDHLEGEEVAILGDGAVQPSKTVSGGAITLDSEASEVVIGLPFTSVLETMPIEFDLRDGSSIGRNKRITDIIFDFWKSLGGEFAKSADASQWFPIRMRDTSDLMGSSPPLFTGTKQVSTDFGHSTRQSIAVRQTQPLPFSIIGLTAEVKINDN